MGKRKSLRALGEEYGVSYETVRKWKAAGVDVYDAEAVAEYRDTVQGEDRSQEPETLTEARRVKVLEDTRLVRLRIEREEGMLVPVDEVQRAGVRIGVSVKQQLMRLGNDLAPMLEGLPAGRMKEVIEGAVRNILREWEKFAEEAIEDAKEGRK